MNGYNFQNFATEDNTNTWIPVANKKNMNHTTPAGIVGQIFVFESLVRNFGGSDYQTFYKNGYRLVAAANGDWDACNKTVRGIACQNSNAWHVFLNAAHNGVVRINLLWMKS